MPGDSGAMVMAGLIDSLPGPLQELISILPIIFLGFLVYLMWRAVQAMPRTKPAKIEPDSKSIVRWDEVAGVEEARAELVEVVDFLSDPSRFEKLGARVPKGILLYGPPGTGKTLLAKAVAGESGAHFFSASASSFVEMFAGVGASRIRKLFETARRNTPAIVFIDELDAVGTVRSGSGVNREQDQTLNQLLVELDGFTLTPGVVVMGSTNRLESLDPALLRPGRFDRQVLVAPPDLAGRIEILKVHTRKKPLDDDVAIEAIARSTSGLTGADLENIANEAAIRAGRAHRSTITRADFDDALERILAGLRTRHVISEKEKRIIAYHEAGHALVSHLLGDAMPLQKVTIVPRGGALGFNLNLPDEDRFLATREELVDQLRMLLGGRAAEQIVFGRISNGAANDLERATGIARAMVFEWGMGELVEARTLRADNFALSEETKRLRDAEQSRLCDNAYEHALRLLARNRPALARLADRLLAVETLERSELKSLLADVEPESMNARSVGTVLEPPPTLAESG